MARKGKIQRNKQYKEEIKRPERLKKYKQYFLIVCEDQNTEPTYFEQFRGLFPENTMYLKTVGTGRDPLGVVEQAIQQKGNLKSEIGYRQGSNIETDIDFVWVVFDKDDADFKTVHKKICVKYCNSQEFSCIYFL